MRFREKNALSPNRSHSSQLAARDYDAIVVGAGFAGLYMLHKLREAGLTAVVFEAASDVGGVWYWNRYPGARCDVESLQYSYSFSEDLQQDWVWSQRFAEQPEILAYIRHVADRFDLRRDIVFDTRVDAMVFDESASLWQVRTNKGGVARAKFCMMASGSLSAARVPDFPGIETFAGQCFHTGDWPHTRVDLRGRRVAIIGTGSSGIQAVPVIAAEAAQLYVFQRTPNFVIPARNQPLDDEKQRVWKRNYAQHSAKARLVGTAYELSDKGALDVSAAERQHEYDRRWNEGGVNFVHSFKDIYLDMAANDTAADFVRARIRDLVTDPEVSARLAPTDHPLGTKRICVGADYYEAFNRANVELVDVRAAPIQAITATGIKTHAMDYAVDTIVFATGYDALTGALTRIDIRGRGGLALKDKWVDGPRNYLGLMTAGFPNFFIITGPGSPSVLINMIVAIEQHVEWIARCITDLDGRGASLIEANVEAEDFWVAHVNAEADLTLFPKANSWYVGANIPGKPRVFLPYVGGIGRYRARCDDIAARNYEGFRITTRGAGETAA